MALVLWVGINYVSINLINDFIYYNHLNVLQGYDGRRMVFGWVYYVIAHRIYEFFLMVYILVWIGGHRVMVQFYLNSKNAVTLSYLPTGYSLCGARIHWNHVLLGA
jgi:hypothetical protein